MRFSLPVSPLFAALLSALLAACAAAPAAPAKNVSQSGSLKIHPGLLGQPVPPELQPQGAPAATPAGGGNKADDNKADPGKLKPDDAGPRSQSSVYFDLDSAALKAEFIAVLQGHARYLAQHPEVRVRLEGHADERGPSDYNKRLGLKRAESVKLALLDQGIGDRQIKVISQGESSPKLKGHDEESWAENRRADIMYEKKE